MMRIVGKANRATLVVGKTRCPIQIVTGPWVKGVAPELIKLRAKRWCFQREILDAMPVENGSDPVTDYYEPDCIRLMPGHPLYNAAKAVAEEK